MDPRPRKPAKWILPVLIAAHLAGCATGPLRTTDVGTGLILYTDEQPAQAERLSREARTFLEELAEYLDLQAPGGGLLRIYHYPNRWGLWRHLSREVPSLRWRRGVCYETEEAYVVALCGNPVDRGFREILRHELTHALIAAHFRDIPPWIDEGLAQVMASGPPFPHLEQDRLDRVHLEARRAQERGCLRLLHVPPGRKLTPSQYLVACALTYSLLSRSPEAAPGRLIRFLETSQLGGSPERTFEACWGMSMEEACRALVSSADPAPRTGIRASGPGFTP